MFFNYLFIMRNMFQFMKLYSIGVSGAVGKSALDLGGDFSRAISILIIASDIIFGLG